MLTLTRKGRSTRRLDTDSAKVVYYPHLASSTCSRGRSQQGEARGTLHIILFLYSRIGAPGGESWHVRPTNGYERPASRSPPPGPPDGPSAGLEGFKLQASTR